MKISLPTTRGSKSFFTTHGDTRGEEDLPLAPEEKGGEGRGDTREDSLASVKKEKEKGRESHELDRSLKGRKEKERGKKKAKSP